MSESVIQFLGLLLILVFAVWGIAGLFASLWNKRSTLRTWWRGSRYGSVGEPGAGPVLTASRSQGKELPR
jgi:hypothetical protein